MCAFDTTIVAITPGKSWQTAGKSGKSKESSVIHAALLLLGGEPLNEPIVGHGPFVMNTREEIVQAMRDFGSGKFGAMEARS